VSSGERAASVSRYSQTGSEETKRWNFGLSSKGPEERCVQTTQGGERHPASRTSKILYYLVLLRAKAATAFSAS